MGPDDCSEDDRLEYLEEDRANRDEFEDDEYMDDWMDRGNELNREVGHEQHYPY